MDYFKKKDVQAILFLCLLNIVIRLPFIHHPAFWDEVNYLNGAVAVFGNNLNPFVNFWGYKPPVVFEPVATLFTLFSPSMVWARLYIFVCSSLALFFCYLLGKILFNKNVGLISTLLLFVFPLFSAQSLLYLDAIPLTALCLSTFYFYFSGKKIAYVVSATLLCLTKEPALFIPVAIIIYDTLLTLHSGKNIMKLLINKMPLFLFPILIFLFWLIINKLTLGWFLFPYNVGLLLKQEWRNYFNSQLFFSIFLKVFLSQTLWFPFSITLIGLILSFNNKLLRKKELVLFIILFTFYFFFYYFSSFALRYLLFVYPFVFIYLAYFITTIFSEAKLPLLVVICYLFISYIIFPHSSLSRSFGVMEDDDFHYLKDINNQKNVAEYINKQFPDYEVVAAWPFSEYYSNPLFGYIKKKNVSIRVDCLTGNYAEIPTNNKRIYINSNMNCVPVVIPKDTVMITKLNFGENYFAEIYLKQNEKRD